MNNAFWKPGSIVKLNEPYKPSRYDGSAFAFISYAEYKAWKGFTHGVIVQVFAHDHQGNPSNVSLFLYDPQRCAIYVDSQHQHGIPTYTDYHVSELTPLKDGAVVGYEPIRE